jgi:hypothetical protein
VKFVTDSNKTSAIPPLKYYGQIYKVGDKAELLNTIFASKAQLDDGGKSPSICIQKLVQFS